MPALHSLLLLTALLLQPSTSSNENPCAAQVHSPYRKLVPVLLDTGAAWGLVPARENSDEPTFICFLPHTDRHTVKTIAVLPPYKQEEQEKAYASLRSLHPAGDWLVIGYNHQVPGWAQPSGFHLKALQPTTGQRLSIWEGLATGGNQMQYTVGTGTAVVATGVTTPDGVGRVAITYVRFHDNYRARLPVTTWPRSLRYHEGAYLIVDAGGHLHRFDNRTGAKE